MKQRTPYPIGVLPYRHSIIGRTLLTVPRPPAVSLCPLMHCATAFFSFRADRIPCITDSGSKPKYHLCKKIAQSRGILHHVPDSDRGEIFSRDRRLILVRGRVHSPRLTGTHCMLKSTGTALATSRALASIDTILGRGASVSAYYRALILSARRATNMKGDAGGFVLL